MGTTYCRGKGRKTVGGGYETHYSLDCPRTVLHIRALSVPRTCDPTVTLYGADEQTAGMR